MDDPTLHDDDVHAWAEQQADMLRRLARTRVDLPNELDLENVAEEIEDVGIAQRNAAESFIRQIFVHLIKLSVMPAHEAARHRRGEIVAFHNELLQRLTPSMHGRIEVVNLWSGAVKEVDARYEGDELRTAVVAMKLKGPPLTIEELAAEDLDLDAVLAKLRSPGP
jgi:hypothetical protein